MLNLDAEVLTWQGRTSGMEWPNQAREALNSGHEFFQFEVEEGVGIAGYVRIRPLGAETELSVAIDALGRTRGLLTYQGEHTATLAVALAALSKSLPFDMATSKGELIDNRMLVKSTFWTDLGFSFEKVSVLAYQLNVIPNPQLRQIAGAAVFF